MAVSVHIYKPVLSVATVSLGFMWVFIPETVRLPLLLSGPKCCSTSPPTRICVPITVALILFAWACKINIFHPLISPHFVWGHVSRKWFAMSLYDFELLPHLPSTRISAPIHIASIFIDIFTETQRVTSPNSSITLKFFLSSFQFFRE